MTPEIFLIFALGLAACLVRMLLVPEGLIQKLRLRPLAISILVAVPLTPTPDILTCLLVAGVLFMGYLLGTLVVWRIGRMALSAQAADIPVTKP